MSLRISVLSGIRWTGLSSIFLNLLRVIQISVLARFLNKEDFGIIAIVMIVIMFVKMFLDLGISPAIVHRQSITYDELNSLYWLNIIIAFVLFFIIFLISPLVSSFYGNSKICFFTRIVAFSLIIQSFGKQFFTLFEKELQFSVISKIQIFSSTIATIISVFMAIFGFGIYSIIVPTLVNSFLSSTMFFVKGSKVFYRPRLYFSFSDIRYFLKFGIVLTGGSIINYFNSKFDEILIGKLLGNTELGLYSVSKNLVQKPASIINPIITRVTFPAMSKVQDDIEKLKNIYLKTINYVASINFFIYMLIFVFSDLLVNVLLGSKWNDAVSIIRILSLYFMLRSIGNPIGTLVLARGKPHYSLYWNLALFILIPITIYISSSYGILGVVWGWVFLMLILMIPNWYFLVRPLCNANFVEYFSQILMPFLFNILMFGVSLIFKEILLLKDSYFTLIFLPLALLFFVLYNWLFNRDFLFTIFALFFPLVRRRDP